MKAALDLVHVAARCHLLVIAHDPPFLTGGIAYANPPYGRGATNEHCGIGRILRDLVRIDIPPELITFGRLPSEPPYQITFADRVQQVERVSRRERDAVHLVTFWSRSVAHRVTKDHHARNVDVQVGRQRGKSVTGVNREDHGRARPLLPQRDQLAARRPGARPDASFTIALVFDDVRRSRWRVVDGSPVAMMPRCAERLGRRRRSRRRRWRRIDRDWRVRERRGLRGPPHAHRLPDLIAPGDRIERRWIDHRRESTAHRRILMADRGNPAIALYRD